MWQTTSAPRGKNHDTSTFWVGQGPFSNNFFFAGMKIKTNSNYRDENHI